MPQHRGEQVIETTTEARQGVTGHNVRYVLAFGTGGAILGLLIVTAMFFWR